MGNRYSSSKSLKFFIETEKPYYNSGSSIEGTIFVEAKKNFSFDALYIRIEGTFQDKSRDWTLPVVLRELKESEKVYRLWKLLRSRAQDI